MTHPPDLPATLDLARQIVSWRGNPDNTEREVILALALLGAETALIAAAKRAKIGREPTEKELRELGDVIELNDPLEVIEEGLDPYPLERAIWAYVRAALESRPQEVK